MDETRRISLIAGGLVMATFYAYFNNYINLTEYYIIMFGFIIPIIGGYTGWNLFLRRAFSLHFQMEEGNHLREVGYVRILPLDKDKTLIDRKVGKVLKQFWIDSRNTVYTDRFNKSHLFFPVNNVFAFHPFAKTYSLTEAGDIPEEFKQILLPENQPEVQEKLNEAKIPDAILSPEENKKREEAEKNKKDEDKKAKSRLPIGAIPIQFFTLMTVSAIEFAQLFSGKLIIARMEASRNKGKRDKNDIFLGIALGAMIGIIVGVFLIPLYTGMNHTVTANTQNTISTITQYPTSSTTISTSQTIPTNARITGESTIVVGNLTTSYTTYANNVTTITVTHTTSK